jgi:hypothetical protein
MHADTRRTILTAVLCLATAGAACRAKAEMDRSPHPRRAAEPPSARAARLGDAPGRVTLSSPASDRSTPAFPTVPEPTTLALWTGVAYAALARPERSRPGAGPG